MNESTETYHNQNIMALLLIALIPVLLLALSTGYFAHRAHKLARYGTQIEEGSETIKPWTSSVEDGYHRVWGYVKFDNPFEHSPRVLAGLASIGTPACSFSNMQVVIENVDRFGFTYKTSPWLPLEQCEKTDAQTYEPSALRWVAFDRHTPANALGVGQALTEDPVRLFDGTLAVEPFERGILFEGVSGDTDLVRLRTPPPGIMPYGAIGEFYFRMANRSALGNALEGEREVLDGAYHIHIFKNGLLIWRTTDSLIETVVLDQSFTP
jgi:hypothetical protein